ncbi:MAG: peptidylprolyl isomerase [Deltaproteobacteria bacterium]|nr:peptidylprolyl isomerase [Nannocystaceae bacterium]
MFSWLILATLALVFGLQFGLPSDSLSFGKASFVKVHGEKIGEEDYRFQLGLVATVLDFEKIDERIRKFIGVDEEILESMIEREVLTDAAHDLGLEATERDVEDLVLAGHFIVLGETMLRLGPKDEFNYDSFLKFVRAMSVSEPRYMELQRHELLARVMRDVVASSTAISERELRQIYDDGANRMTLRVARYSPLRFGELVDPSEEAITAYLAAHEDELVRQYGSQGSRFAKLPKQARVWVLEVRKPEPADAAALAKARASIEQARKRIVGGEDFRKLARELSQHETATRGGEVGWVGLTAGTGVDPELDKLLAELTIGTVSEVIEGEKGFYLALVRKHREGDIAQADALPELAEDGVRTEQGEQLARSAAEEDLAALKSGAALADVFSGGSALGGTAGIDTAGADKRVKAQLDDTGSFPKGEPIPGVGPAPDVVAAAWAAEPDSSMIDALFEVGQDIVLVGLVEKQVGSDAGFAEIRADLYRGAVERKGELVTARWTQRRCLEAKAKGELTSSPEQIAKLIPPVPAPAEGEPPLDGIGKPYETCDRVGNRGGLLRAAAGLGGVPGEE